MGQDGGGLGSARPTCKALAFNILNIFLNWDSVPTYIRIRGDSVVGISFASPDLSPHVLNWRVMDEMETYSDHWYIRFGISAQTSSTPVR